MNIATHYICVFHKYFFEKIILDFVLTFNIGNFIDFMRIQTGDSLFVHLCQRFPVADNAIYTV